MLVIRRRFETYQKMIDFLSTCEQLTKADFELKDGKWMLNIARFEKHITDRG